MAETTLRRRVSGPPRTTAARSQPGVHLCPGIDCRTLVSPGLIACREHWLTIPRPDRTVLADAFRQRTTNPVLYTEAIQLAHQLLTHHDPRKATP